MLNRTTVNINSDAEALKLIKRLEREEKQRNKALSRKNPTKVEVVQYLKLRNAKIPLFLPAPRGYDPNSSESHPRRAVEEMKELLNDAAKLFDEGRTLGAFQKAFDAGCRWGEYNVWKEAHEGAIQEQKKSRKNLEKFLRPRARRQAIAKVYRELKLKNPPLSDSRIAEKIVELQEKERLWSGDGEDVGAELIRKEIQHIRKLGWIE